MLHRLGGPKGIIRASEFFLYSKTHKQAVQRCLERGYRFPEVTGWIRANKKDFKLVKELGLEETGILTSASDYHIFLKLGMKRRQAADLYKSIVCAALDKGIRVRCHLEDATRADYYGFVVPFVQELMELAQQAKIPVKIRICDTMGFGVPYPGAAMPRSVAGLIYGLINYAGVPSEWLEWHGHNDFHKVLVNAATAWLYGCCAANGTLLGIGERTGNPPIEGLVMEYAAIRGTTDGMDLSVLSEISDYYTKEIGYRIPENSPFVGKSFNVTSAGIHADGMIKHPEIYNIFDTEKILRRPPGVAVTSGSGLAGLALWVNTRLAGEGKEQVSKSHPILKKIKRVVDAEFAKGRVTAMSDTEMEALCRRYLPDLFGPPAETTATPGVGATARPAKKKTTTEKGKGKPKTK